MLGCINRKTVGESSRTMAASSKNHPLAKSAYLRFLSLAGSLGSVTIVGKPVANRPSRLNVAALFRIIEVLLGLRHPSSKVNTIEKLCPARFGT